MPNEVVRPDENEYVFIWVVILSLWRKGDAHHTGTSPLATLAFVYLYPLQTSPRSPCHRYLALSLFRDPQGHSYLRHFLLPLPRMFFFQIITKNSCNLYSPTTSAHTSTSFYLPHSLVWYSLFHLSLSKYIIFIFLFFLVYLSLPHCKRFMRFRTSSLLPTIVSPSTLRST